MQKRLYREIKLRKILELWQVKLELNPPKLRQNLRIETVAVARLIRAEDSEVPWILENVKRELADCIARKLIDEGLVEFKEAPRYRLFSYEVEARLKVLRPEQEDGHDDNGLL